MEGFKRYLGKRIGFGDGLDVEMRQKSKFLSQATGLVGAEGGRGYLLTNETGQEKYICWVGEGSLV